MRIAFRSENSVILSTGAYVDEIRIDEEGVDHDADGIPGVLNEWNSTGTDPFVADTDGDGTVDGSDGYPLNAAAGYAGAYVPTSSAGLLEVYAATHGTLWQYGIATSGPGAASGITTDPYVWATNLSGNYIKNAQEYLYLPLLDLTAGTNPTLSMRLWSSTAYVNYHGTNVEVLVGGLWTVMNPYITPYDGKQLNDVALPAWEETLGSYVLAAFDLTPYVGQQLQVRIAFRSENSVILSTGAYVDEIRIDEEGSDPDGDGVPGIWNEYLSSGTDPFMSDTDGDGFSDGAELIAGSDPLSAASFPNSAPTISMPADNYAVNVTFNGVVSVPVSGTDAEGNSFIVSIQTQPTFGYALNSGLNIDYYAMSSIGIESLTYQLVDSYGAASGLQTLWFSVTGSLANPPIFTYPINPWLISMNMNGSAAFQSAATDADPGDVLSFSISSAATSGTATIDGYGYVTYTPNTGYVGSDSFTVRVTDFAGLFSEVTVNAGVVSGVQVQGDSTITSTLDMGNFGQFVAVGDVNGDGYGDLLAPDTAADSVYIFFGSASGIPTGIAESNADVTITSNYISNRFGSSIATGDVNHDGFDDIVIGSMSEDGYVVTTGAVYLIPGSASLADGYANVLASHRWYGEATGDWLGVSVAVGDLNNDGYAEILAGAKFYDAYGTISSGAFYLLDMTTSPVSGAIASAATATITGTASLDYLGDQLAVVGDVNGDGYADVLAGASNTPVGALSWAGHAYLFYGPQLTSGTADLYASVRFSGIAASERVGLSVGAAGDVNSDGYADMLIGANGFDSYGAVYLVLGGSGLTDGYASGLAAATYKGASVWGSFGFSVAGGNVNGDLYSDLVVGAPGAGVGGEGYIFYGSSSLTNRNSATADVMRSTGVAADSMGEAVAVGDLNGDGYADVVFGTPQYNEGNSFGSLVIYYGTASLDSDGDGISNADEAILGTDPFHADSDGDGLSDGAEVYTYGTNPLAADSDGDGFNDGTEISFGSNPLDTNSIPPSINAGTLLNFEDVYGGGLIAAGAVWEHGVPVTGPMAAWSGSNVWATGLAANYPDDADATLTLPLLNMASATNPRLSMRVWASNEAGWDGLRLEIQDNSGVWQTLTPEWGGYNDFDFNGNPVWGDVYGAAHGQTQGASAPVLDTNGYFLAIFNLDPYVAWGSIVQARLHFLSDSSVNQEGSFVDDIRFDDEYTDPDGDGLVGILAETANGADPFIADSDGDGLLDGAEVNTYGTDPSNPDSDGDGVSDGIEITFGYDPLNALSHPNQPVFTYPGNPWLISMNVNGSAAFQSVVTDLDPGDVLSYSISAAASNGTAAVDSYGYVSYTANAGYVGSDSFNVRVTDSFGLFSELTVNAAMVTGQTVPADSTIISVAAMGNFGQVLATGDVNGDGYSDLLASDRSQDALYIFYGSASGLASPLNQNSANVTIRSSAGKLTFGEALATGDVNHDGIDDIVVGSSNEDGYALAAGVVYLIAGSPSLADGYANVMATSSWYGAAASDYLGSAVAIGDLNSDGYAEILAGAKFVDVYAAPSSGAFYVLDMATAPASGSIAAVASARITGSTANEYLGGKLAVVGDVNGDGYGDILASVDSAVVGGLFSVGRAYLFYGPQLTSGTADVYASVRYTGSVAYDQVGRAIAAAGDVNGDGYADMLIGANGADSYGYAYIVMGSNALVDGYVSALATATFSGVTSADSFAWAVAGSNVNGDAYSDLIVGASGAGVGGEGYIFYGSASPTSRNSSTADVMRTSGDISAATGEAVAAGDLNGDGYADVAFGVPLYSELGGFNSVIIRYGTALADSDGDGISNADEAILGTNPNLADTDSDGLSDGAEVYTYGTNPLSADTDGDGYNDSVEITFGSNPLDANSIPPSIAVGTLLDLEDVYGGGLVASGGVWEHGIPTTGPMAAWSGSKVWATGLAVNYPDNANAALALPLLNMASATNPRLSMRVWASNETGWDGLRLEIQDNSGVWQTLIPEWGGYDFFENNNVSSPVWGDVFAAMGTALQGPAPVMDSYGYFLAIFNLDPYVAWGSVAQARLHFLSDTSYNQEGSFVDDIRFDDEYTDPDGDGLVGILAETAYGADPFIADSDGDGLLDGAEVNTYGSDPTNPDSDGDGLSDGDEVNIYGTSPTLADTDDDGFSDSVEIAYGSNPLDPNSVANATPVAGLNLAGGALSFNGIDQYATIASTPTVDSYQNVTVEAWIRTAQVVVSSGTPDADIIEKWDNLFGYPFALRLTVATGQIWFGSFDGVNNPRITSITSVNDGQWHHIAAVRSGNASMALYIDGVAEDLYAGAYLGGLLTAFNPAASGNAAPLYLGRRGNVTQTNFYQGDLDEVRLWNVARTQAQVQADMYTTLTGAETGLGGYWNFDGIVDVYANDLTANANHGWMGSGAAIAKPVQITSGVFAVSNPGNVTMVKDSYTTLWLGGTDAENDPLTIRVDTLPSQGTLWQTLTGLDLYSQIIVPFTNVTDARGRVIYSPLAGQTGAPYSTFDFTAHDPYTTSGTATININVTP